VIVQGAGERGSPCFFAPRFARGEAASAGRWVRPGYRPVPSSPRTAQAHPTRNPCALPACLRFVGARPKPYHLGGKRHLDLAEPQGLRNGEPGFGLDATPVPASTRPPAFRVQRPRQTIGGRASPRITPHLGHGFATGPTSGPPLTTNRRALPNVALRLDSALAWLCYMPEQAATARLWPGLAPGGPCTATGGRTRLSLGRPTKPNFEKCFGCSTAPHRTVYGLVLRQRLGPKLPSTSQNTQFWAEPLLQLPSLGLTKA